MSNLGKSLDQEIWHNHSSDLSYYIKTKARCEPRDFGYKIQSIIFGVLRNQLSRCMDSVCESRIK